MAMTFKYVVAVVPTGALERLESELKRMQVGGVTLSKVKGFGEYKNFFTGDWLSDHTKVEIFVEDSKTDDLVSALRGTACDLPGAGIVAVMPTERFLHLRTGAEILL
jgi:nitrogen regulatory protein P-II 1